MTGEIVKPDEAGVVGPMGHARSVCQSLLCENGRVYDERWTNGREWSAAWHECPHCGGSGLEPQDREGFLIPGLTQGGEK